MELFTFEDKLYPLHFYALRSGMEDNGLLISRYAKQSE